jgi:4-hydroxybenzoate polyprenyltransferase
VICVDVDGTLLRTDLLFESLFCLLKEKLWLVFLVPLWLIRGKAYLKRKLAERVSFDDTEFPLNAPLVTFLTNESQLGRSIILCSASDESLVRRVSKQLPFFVEVIATRGGLNLKGENKANALVDRFGAGGFDYAGNSSDDLVIWRRARQAIVVNASNRVEHIARAQGNVTLVLPRTGNEFFSLLQSMRIYQWVKNTLIFVPLITSHRFLEVGLLVRGAIAFLSLSLCASAIYILNDVFDLHSDRNHPTKRKRPLASGSLSISTALVSVPLLFGTGILVSLLLPWTTTAPVLVYAAMSLAYVFRLKQMLLADVVALALLYTVRIVIGGVATSLLVSPWLLGFSLFLFISFAFSKRVAEMIRASGSTRRRLPGRSYLVDDIPTVACLGALSGYLACLVLSFYINSRAVFAIYRHPVWLWLLLPLMLYWVGRIWVLTMRGHMSDDPIIFVFKDAATRWAFFAAAVILLLATKCPFGIPGIGE